MMNRGPWTFYRDRPEWKDVHPIPQDDDERGVIRIAYSDKFTDVHDYLRAILVSQEVSKRALDLTKDAVTLNPANYTSWQHRRMLLEALNEDLEKELRFLDLIIDENSKNYQVWYHRQWLVDKIGEDDMTIVDNILEDDAKNYHAWEYRQWAVRRFNLWDEELSYTENLIEEDFRNNSAWNQRFFVIKNTSGFTNEVVNKETDYVQYYLDLAPFNESAWNYLRGIYLGRPLHKELRLREYCEKLAQETEANPSPHLVGFLLMLYEDILENKKWIKDRESGEVVLLSDDEFSSLLQNAHELTEKLAKEIDRIRINYWLYVQRRILTRFGQPVPTDTGDNLVTEVDNSIH